jgi:predicted amino acid-binding ACT domain protein
MNCRRLLMEIVIRDEIKDVFSSVGVNDISSFIENEAIMMLLAKESKYKAEYDKFKNKYNAEFEEFEKKVRDSNKEDFEVEDDLMDWEFAYHALKNIKEKKRALSV